MVNELYHYKRATGQHAGTLPLYLSYSILPYQDIPRIWTLLNVRLFRAV